MKKEQLLNIKKELVQKSLSYTGLTVSESDIKNFSIRQLEILCNILKQNIETIEKRNGFVALSTTQVLCKQNDKIVDFDFEGTGDVKEVNREYVMLGASRMILEKYENEKDNK